VAELTEQPLSEGAQGAPTSPGADQVERLLAELNPAQREAVTHGAGPILVLAGAGSGKTRVLTHRIAYLLATGQARPGEILAITFTNKAAQEMRERVEQLVGRATRAMWVMTFHSACARIMRAEAERLGYSRGFTISGAKNKLLDAASLRETQGSIFEETAADVYALYERRMLEANAMDFDDLLLRTVNVLELFEPARERWRRAFNQVLVDEYQDTNRAQYRLLQLLADQHRNLFVVGDDAQSIYSFRHAEIRNILDFERDFPDASVVMLEQNYRSTQTILSATNELISHNRDNRPKHLFTEGEQGEPIQVVQLGDEHEEARWVAGEVERLVTDEGVRRDEIAVFYRTNAMSRVLEDTLVRFELPYQVIGGTKFYERAEIKDAVAYMSLLVNPSDAISFGRVVNSPRRGIGNTSQGRLLAHANTTGLPIWDVAARPDAVPGLGAAAVKAISRFHQTLAGLRERTATAPVAELLEAILHETGYLEALEAERTVEAEGRVENLQELIGVAGEFDANRELEGEGEVSPLEEFLQQISLLTQQDELREEQSLVTLMTIHNAKGLEYETVFLIGCEEGVFPHMRALEEGGEEEERRLCYVGMTRARSRLYLTYARERRIFGGRREPAIASRFIAELPDGLTEQERSEPRAGEPWAPVGGGLGQPIAPGPALELQTGDDIVHASFGDGVVTGIEPGGVIVVRFAGDPQERKLMADYAPVKKK
jgi:DNA helicase-2/ATP-dependent DNA helicase PcrA